MPDRPFAPLKTGRSYSVRFAPDSRLVATIARNVVLWDVETRQRVAHAHPFSHPSRMDFSPTGDRLAVKNTAGHLCVLSVPDLALLVAFDKRGATEGNQISFSPCGDYLIDSDWDGRIAVRDARTGAFVRKEHLPDTMIRWFAARADRQAFAFGPYLRALATDGPPPGLIACRTWPFTDTVTPTLNVGNLAVDQAALSPDGRAIAALVASGYPEIQLTLLEQCGEGWGSRRMTLSHKGGTQKAIAWSPDGTQIALTEDDCISTFDVATLTCIARHALPYPCDVTWSPDGRLLALGSWTSGVVIDARSMVAS